ncbi:YegS/Rv2252/BmrU family lipid kinase [Jeotgalibaca ciconiae]|uniref:YegS/Rv2252/BmrU family lipid kinase n=2 Tax=Jeotgalibaca ciconiae TaxID=2496265 RepID=A0A3Q9BLR3_9LACT|nr:YegS/Rv2252/BmrU family lipid kinase [Jeotgalibaca ciconiae]
MNGYDTKEYKMTTRYHIIANLHSGSGKGKKVVLDVHKKLNEKKIPFLLYQTEYRKHAITLIQKVIANMNLETDRILVIGGDGTLHEVIAGMSLLEKKIPVGYLPAGTGNDFARAIDLPTSYHKGLANILHAEEPQIMECFLYEDAELKTIGVGLNSLGMGFDGKIIEILDNKHTKRNILSAVRLEKLIYLNSIADAFKKRKTFEVEVTVDNKTSTYSDVLIAGAMNHPYFGGGIKIDPESNPNTSELAIMIIKNLSFPNLVRLLTKVLTSGKHIHSPYFERLAGKELEIKVSEPVPTQVDGELLPEEQYHFHFKLSAFLLWK